jgi:signal transduction histidine kinase
MREPQATERDPRASNGFPELARALVEAGHEPPRIMDALATSLTTTLCDRCSIDVTLESRAESERRDVTSRHAVLSLHGTRLLHGYVTVMRDETSPAFDARDFSNIETCISYASLAAEVALALEVDRAALRAEHDRAEQFYRTLLGIVGHDLRAPVAAILFGTEMLVAQRQDDPSLADVVTRIVSFANRMTAMVDQLLDLAHVQLGSGIPVARCKMRLVPLIESVVGALAERYPRNHFSIVGDAELAGIWDPDRLRQVAASVVANAVQHGLEDGAVDIVISQDKRFTTIEIHNDVRDAPISPETMRRLFEPGRRGDDEPGPGLGLGLYIVREIVVAHGGCIAVESTATGTTFRVVLPTTGR